MNNKTNTHNLPAHYVRTTHIVIKYCVVMIFVALLFGIAYQESAKKIDFTKVSPGLHIEATIHLALVHGHIFVSTVLVPLAMLGAMFMSLKAGGTELSSRMTRWLTRGYLPFVTFTVILMMYKGYHFLLRVRFGETDLDTVNDMMYGGITGLRHAVYGLAHVGMAVSLCVFVIGLWRSLKKQPALKS